MRRATRAARDEEAEASGSEVGVGKVGGALESAKTPFERTALARKYRHDRRFVKTLPPAEVDAFVRLVPIVAKEKLDRAPMLRVDMGESICVAFEVQGDGRLRALPLGGSDATRRGPDAERLMTWLRRASEAA